MGPNSRGTLPCRGLHGICWPETQPGSTRPAQGPLLAQMSPAGPWVRNVLPAQVLSCTDRCRVRVRVYHRTWAGGTGDGLLRAAGPGPQKRDGNPRATERSAGRLALLPSKRTPRSGSERPRTSAAREKLCSSRAGPSPLVGGGGGGGAKSPSRAPAVSRPPPPRAPPPGTPRHRRVPAPLRAPRLRGAAPGSRPGSPRPPPRGADVARPQVAAFRGPPL